MTAKSIDYAINTLTAAVRLLENAYWESSDIQCKDRVFDLYSVINEELTELSKLSVNDLELPFEPITDNFSEACKKFGLLMNNLETWFARSSTVQSLREVLPKAALLVSDSCHI